MKIVGYGVCGKGEADRYMEATLKEFARLCDQTFIVGNNIGEKEEALIKKYDFTLVTDNTEWGKLQWKIKEDLIKNHIAKAKPDLCVCLDMDETFDPNMTRKDLENLMKSPFEAFYFYIVDLWGDGYSKAHSFWNIRAWKFIPELGFEFPKKALHCGLGPEWVWSRGYYSPHFVLHSGLKKAKDRIAKVLRYKKYDPKAQFIAKSYYDDLEAEIREDEFEIAEVRKEVKDYVKKIEQKHIKRTPKEKKVYVFIRKSDGNTIDIPKKGHEETLKRNPDWEVIGTSEDL